MSDTQIENLLREIRDLQAALLDEMRGHNQRVDLRGDLVFGNPQRNRVLVYIFYAIAISFILGVALFFAH